MIDVLQESFSNTKQLIYTFLSFYKSIFFTFNVSSSSVSSCMFEAVVDVVMDCMSEQTSVFTCMTEHKLNAECELQAHQIDVIELKCSMLSLCGWTAFSEKNINIYISSHSLAIV